MVKKKIGIKKIIIARHYGFCMGVKRAISTAETTMVKEKRVTILNEIVHNEAIVERFSRAGVGQSKSINDITCGTLIVSAHGASPQVFKKAAKKGLKIVDATCPLVIHIHNIIKRLAEDGYHILHFGDPEHDETIGIVGHAPSKVTVIQNAEMLNGLNLANGKIALTAQTTAGTSDFTFIEKAVRKKYPGVKVYNTICNATSQRQAAVTALAPKVDLMLIVGSSTSANSKRLAQISKTICPQSYLINSADDIEVGWFTDSKNDVKVVGLTAGASTPDFLITGAINRLKELTESEVEVIYPPTKIRRNRLKMEEKEN